MTRSVKLHYGTGSNWTYPITFENGYLDKRHVTVFLEDALGNLNSRTFTWASDTSIVLNGPAPLGPNDNFPLGQPVYIYRTMPKNVLPAQFSNNTNEGVATNANSFNRMQRYLLMLIDEALDGRLLDTDEPIEIPESAPPPEILFGTGDPGNNLGKTGDAYFENNGDVWKKTGSTTWTYQFTITGTAGASGSRALFGSGVPGAGLGNNGDTYFRTNGEVYAKAAGVWTLQFTITGSSGASGTQWGFGGTFPDAETWGEGNVWVRTDTKQIFIVNFDGSSYSWALQVDLNGTPGSQVYFNAEAPDETFADGVNGDIVFATTPGAIYKKEADEWVEKATYSGTVWWSGSGDPSAASPAGARVGDFYFQSTGPKIWGPRIAGSTGSVWGYGYSLDPADPLPVGLIIRCEDDSVVGETAFVEPGYYRWTDTQDYVANPGGSPVLAWVWEGPLSGIPWVDRIVNTAPYTITLDATWDGVQNHVIFPSDGVVVLPRPASLWAGGVPNGTLRCIRVIQGGAGKVTLQAATGTSIVAGDDAFKSTTRRNECIVLQPSGSNWRVS